MKQYNKWLLFTIVGIAQFMVVLDASITNIALPAIKQSLHFNSSMLQWVITSYALTFGGFLLLGGRASDLFGRRKVLLIGIIGFTIISFLIGMSQSSFMLIALRALQGLAGALMSPAALSIVLTTFKEGPERNKALGFWTTIATGGAATGLLLGGVLTEYLGWRWNFFINVPIGILITAAIFRMIPAHENEEKSGVSLDLLGAGLVTTGLMSLVYVISQAPVWGLLSTPTILMFGLSSVLLALFVWQESQTSHPLIPLSIFKSPVLSGANSMMILIAAGMFGMFYLTSIYLQTVLHDTPITAGLSFLPFPIILGFVSTRMSGLVSKYGYNRFLIIGPFIVAVALFFMSHVPLYGSYVLNVLPAILLMPLGVGMTFMPLFVAATSGVEPSKSGLVSGLINTSQQMGGALGLTILSGIALSTTQAATKYHHGLQAVVIGYDRAYLVAVLFVITAAVLGSTIISRRNDSTQRRQSVDIDPAGFS